MLGRAWLVAMLVSMGACIADRGFPCDGDDRCVLEGVEGRCEASGWCSYPSDACDGGHRYEELAEDGLAGTCVDRLCSVRSLVAGTQHTCAIADDARVWCWGANGVGQLGLGFDSPAESKPRLAEALRRPGSDVSYLQPATAADHACALDDDGHVSCWGLNDEQQAFVTSPAAVLRPVEVPDIVASAVAAGPKATCVVAQTTILCWGDVPNGPTVTVDTEESLVELDGGNRHTCARTGSGSVYCTGDNAKGQLGGMSLGLGGLPAARPIDDGATTIALGGDHACAVVGESGQQDVLCWGHNLRGQTGQPEALEEVAEPVVVEGIPRGSYVELALGAEHSCVRSEDGSVSCWGDNTFGQVAPDRGEGQLEPQRVEIDGEPLIASDLVVGGQHGCALTEDAIVCWGSNAASQLGDAPAGQRYGRIELDCDR